MKGSEFTSPFICSIKKPCLSINSHGSKGRNFSNSSKNQSKSGLNLNNSIHSFLLSKRGPKPNLFRTWHPNSARGNCIFRCLKDWFVGNHYFCGYIEYNYTRNFNKVILYKVITVEAHSCHVIKPSSIQNQLRHPQPLVLHCCMYCPVSLSFGSFPPPERF